MRLKTLMKCECSYSVAVNQQFVMRTPPQPFQFTTNQKVFHNKNKLLFKWSPNKRSALKSGNEIEQEKNQIKEINK